MKSIMIGKFVLTVTLCYWVVYNVVLGFNWFPESEIELILDKVFICLINLGLAFLIYPLIGIYIRAIEKHEKSTNKHKNI